MGFLFFATVGTLLAAQAAPASVVGTVRDGETDVPIRGAVVLLSDLDRATLTDTAGHYLLRDVGTGPQHLTVRVLGYAERTLHALVPRSGQLEINISLRPQAIPLTRLEVRSPARVRGLERGDAGAFPDRGVSIAAVRNHPLLAEPDVLQALSGGTVVTRPESPSGLHVRGGAADQIAYEIDGIPVLSPYHAAGVFSAWNPDALSRIDLSASSSAEHAAALAGTVSATTLAPGPRLRAQGSISTTQARVTADGPLGAVGAGYLLSLRTGFPGMFAPKDEPSYLRGETGDALAKIDIPALGGHIRLLAYRSENELSAAAYPGGDSVAETDAVRNLFEWRSQSIGGEWTDTLTSDVIRIKAWTASADAQALWAAEVGPARLGAARRDLGALAAIEHRSATASTTGGIRFERIRTAYRVASSLSEGSEWRLAGATPLAAAFLEQTRSMSPRTALQVGFSLTAVAGDLSFGPRAQLSWEPTSSIRITGSYARSHQYAQSLRNGESLVGTVFPVDLYVVSRAPGVPTAWSDMGILGIEYRPAPNLRLGVEGYVSGFRDLVLVAPRDGEPFATHSFAAGSGGSRGFAVEAAASGSRYGVLGSYGWQRVRLRHGGASYVPDYGARHVVDTGLILFPTATFSVRIGTTAAFGRGTTPVTNGLEWEACNLLDEGCEFGGSPRHGVDALGTAQLPHYVRVDVGVRKHWHIDVRGRDASVALFGTITNLFSRKNLLTYANDPETVDPVGITMRPLSPLLVGFDWRF
jgi:hypothetical protein